MLFTPLYVFGFFLQFSGEAEFVHRSKTVTQIDVHKEDYNI